MEVVKPSQLTISLVLVALLLLSGCSQTGIYTKNYFHPWKRASGSVPSPSGAHRDADYYVVQKGETLYSIAWQHGYDTRQLASWNGIKPPYTIFPLQKIRLTPPPQVVQRSNPAPIRRNRSYRPAPVTPTLPSQNQDNEKLVWYWPSSGRLLTTFSHTDAGRKGIDIGGRLGQPVRAAAAGKVVYSGNGLRGYGNLIIVKHNEEYFSAYAHNKKNLVKENQTVKARQQIADMGKSGTKTVQLHFEIRRDGKPVNPLRYLPKH